MSDLIKREEAIKAVLGLTMYKGSVPIDSVIYHIKQVPTIDAVEVVRGEWIEHRPPTEGYCGMVECPFCGEELVGEPTDFNYFPNCGAKMSKESE